MTGSKRTFSFFPRTFGQEDVYFRPEETYRRLSRLGYDAIESAPWFPMRMPPPPRESNT